MCDTHEIIIIGLAEELGCQCVIHPYYGEDGVRYSHRWLTAHNMGINILANTPMWLDVGIIDDKIHLSIPLRKPMTFELSYPQLVEQLEKTLRVRKNASMKWGLLVTDHKNV